MAEETKNTYRYIDTDMDRDLLVKNLNHNVQDYVKHKGWDSSKASEFYDALNTYMDALNEGRLSTSRSGSLLDSAGILDNGSARWRDKNGNVISQADYESMKKRKRKNLTNDFYPHREVAGYFNTVAKAFYDAKYNPDKQKKEEEKPAEKFDIDTHGLWNQFVLSLNPSGEGDLQTWMNMDEWNPTEKTRPTTERAKYLGQFIDTYLNKLPENQDFSNYNFTRQEYADLARELQQELQNGATDVDFRLLERLGANPASYQAYFSTAEKPNMEQPTASVDESGLSDEDKENLNNIFNQYGEQARKRNYKSYYYHGNEVKIGGKTDEERLQNYKDYLNKNNIDLSREALQNMGAKEAAAYLPLYHEFAEENTFHPITLGNYQGWEFIPGSFNNKYHSVLAYNPTTQGTRRIWYGDIGDVVDEYNDILRRNYNYSHRQEQPRFQQGGLIELSANAIDKFNSDLKKRSAETKADPKLRQPWNEGNNYSDNELTFTDKARIGSVLADIVAMVDPGPARSAILGLGSDAVNFWADMHEGYGFRKAAGNFAANAALSAVGIIPIFGQAAGSGGKVVKTLVKLAPKLNRALLAAGALEVLSNGDEVLHSFKKLGKDGPENQMNVEDWRNIAMGLQLLVGGAHAARSAHTSKKLKEFGDTGKKLVTVVDKSQVKPNGDESEAIKYLLFGNKETVAELKAAEKQGPEAVQKVIDSYKSMKGKYVLPTEETSKRVFFSGNKGFKKLNPLTWIGTQKGSKISDDYMTDFIDYEAIRRAYNNGKIGKGSNIFSRWWNAELNWIAKNGNYGWNLETVPATNRIYAKHAKVTKETPKVTTKTGTAAATPAATPATTPAATPATKSNTNSKTLSISDIKALRKGATTHYRKLANRGVDIKQAPHSAEGQKLIDAGYKPETLLKSGWWKQGGRLIPKGQAGLYTTNFTLGVPNYKFEVPPLTTLNTPEWKQNSLLLNPITLNTAAKPGGKNYGKDYKSTIESYDNKEYGTSDKVDVSEFKGKSDAARTDALTATSNDENYDYYDAQHNTDVKREEWQQDPNNRSHDFKAWVSEWFANHPNGTQAEMLADYNTLIDNMYTFKRSMATEKHPYRKGDDVKAFNRANKAVYNSANSQGGVHGYQENLENWNGISTAQRFIDITDNDVNDFDWGFTDEDDENFKNLFSGLVKDPTGRYYVQDPDIPAYQPKNNISQLKLQAPTMPYAPAVKETETPEEEEGGDEGTNKGSKWKNLTGALADMRANSIAIGRYLAARNLNRRLLNIAKDMPTMLYRPMEAQRWVRGDQSAIQQGYQAAGQLGHLASQPITANGAEQTATMLEAMDKGQNYINQGYAQNDQTANATAEAVWNQSLANQESRYNTSTKNGENLFGTRVNYLTSLGQKYRADQESLNGLLSQWETQFRENDAANKAYREAVAKASLQNQITANLAANGIDATPEDQKMFNDLLTGKRQLTDLSTEETASYHRISNAISEQVTKKLALTKGAVYTPFTPNPAYNTDDWEVSVPYQRKGGLLAPDSEKITIQKLRGSIQKMLARQRHFEARLNAFEKDMDRSHKGADSYIKGQKKSK